MSKPAFWIVRLTDKDTSVTEEHRFTERARARGFAMMQKALGHSVDLIAKEY